MRVIIAGGSGLIGRELTNLLAAAGDDVIIFSRNPQLVAELPPGSKAVLWDGKTVGDWARYVEDSSAVVNLTGENLSGASFLPSRWTAGRKERLLNSRVNSGRALAQAIEKSSSKPPVFIQASGIGYYGTSPDRTFTEADGPGSDFLARLSVEWETSSQPVEAMGVRRVVIRNGVVLSTTGGALPLMLLPYRLYIGGPLGNGRQVHSWIHLADEARAIQFLIHDAQAQGVFNLTSPNPVTNDEFGQTIGRVMGRPHYFVVPSFAMRLALGEVAEMVLEGQRAKPEKLLGAGFKFKFAVLEEALKDILCKQP